MMTAPGEFWCFVSNLPLGTDSSRLEEVFKSCGARKAKVAVDSRTGKPYRYGRVAFATRDEMVEAIQLMNQTEVEGKKICVHEDEETNQSNNKASNSAAGSSMLSFNKTKKSSIAAEVDKATRASKKQMPRSSTEDSRDGKKQTPKSPTTGSGDGRMQMSKSPTMVPGDVKSWSWLGPTRSFSQSFGTSSRKSLKAAGDVSSGAPRSMPAPSTPSMTHGHRHAMSWSLPWNSESSTDSR